MKKIKPSIIFIVGAVVLVLGIVLGVIFDWGKYAGFAAGLGSSWVVLGIIGIIINSLKPNLAHEKEIESKDERFIRIRERSGNLAFFISIFLNVATTVIFLIMDNFIACLIVIIAMVIQMISYFVAIYVNNKRM